MSQNPSFEKLKSKLPDPSTIDFLIEGLSASEFGSLMLEVYRRRSERISSTDLLRDFGQNRFAQASTIDPVLLLETEAAWLIRAREAAFSPVTLSPVAPLGTCSRVAKVNQNNVLSALRGTEVVSDATNVLALKLAQDLKRAPSHSSLRYAAVHRHLRTQHYDNPSFTAHFGAFCLASAGKDPGSFGFELEEANRHAALLLDRLMQFFPKERLSFTFFLREENPSLKKLLEDSENCWTEFPTAFVTDTSQEYYRLFQFKIYVKIGENLVDFADGGPVDWVASLTGNRKLRSFISGIGLELVLKLAGTV